ncbi:NUDIX hydrolase [Actinotalea sp. AC32]|nr:NUDIX hydrolase [Actinotalea sp. AC32]
MTASTEDRPGTVQAAGALVWRERDGRIELPLVHRPRYQDWSWPKGKLDPGELLPTAAVREVCEEIGEAVVLGVALPSIAYRTSDGKGKRVHYWAARVAGPDDGAALSVRGSVSPAPESEIDEVLWVTPTAAADLLTRRADRLPLERLMWLRERDRLATNAVVVARHGRAQRRSAWKGGEETRPLTGQGRTQAAAMVPVLSAFGVGEVVSSPWERCLRTVTPYAERTGLPVRTVDALTEAAFKEDPAKAAAVVDDLLQNPRGVVVSTHRPVLQSVVDTVNEATRRWTFGSLPTKDPWLKTGEMLVCHVSDGDRPRVVAVERHRGAASE